MASINSIPNPPSRDRVSEKKASLGRSTWALDADKFRLYFGTEPYESRRFLSQLSKFSRAQPSFTAAWPLLKAAQNARRSGAVKGSGRSAAADWQPADINNAMAGPTIAPTAFYGGSSSDKKQDQAPTKISSTIEASPATETAHPTPSERGVPEQKAGVRAILREGPWALDKNKLLEHFGDKISNNTGLLGALERFSKVQPDFSIAFPLLQAASQARRSGVGASRAILKGVEWSVKDVRDAMGVPGGALGQGAGKKAGTTSADDIGSKNTAGKAEAAVAEQKGQKRGRKNYVNEEEHDDQSGKPRKRSRKVVSLNPFKSARPAPPKRRHGRPPKVKEDFAPVTLQITLATKISDIESEDRQKIATAIVKMLVTETRKAVKAGSFILEGQTIDAFGLKLGLAVEMAIFFNYWGTTGKPSALYCERFRAVIKAMKSNPALRDRLLKGTLAPNELSRMSTQKMASQPKVSNQVKGSTHNQKMADVQQGQQDDCDTSSATFDPSSSLGKLSDCDQEPPNYHSSDSNPDQDPPTTCGYPPMSAYIFPDPFDIAVTYLDTCPLLPPDAPVGWPHLIDLCTLARSDTTGLHIADMAVTVLCNHSSKTLARFMDMAHGFTFRVRSGEAASLYEFVIVRDGLEVSVGCLCVGGSRKWGIRHVYRLRGTPMARWTPGWYQEHMEPRQGDVVEVMGEGEAFAFAVLEARVWAPGEGGKIEVRNDVSLD